MTEKKMDYTLLIVIVILAAFGLLMVFSSSYYYAMDKFQDKTHFFISELKWIVLGFFAMIVISRVPYKVYKKAAMPLLVISLFLLIYVLFNGTTLNNAKRWLVIGGQMFQPVEITKISVIIFMAASLEKNYKIMNQPRILGVYLLLILAHVYLIMKQPNMSTAVIVAGIMAVMLFVAGLKWIYVAIIGVLGSGLGVLMINSADYRIDRWTAFLKPFEYKDDLSYQVVQSLYALGTGGIFGVGLGMSTQNKLYIPEPQNDFILATVGEELGFMGTSLLLIAFLILIYRCVKIALNAPDIFSMLLATGVTTMFAIQTVLNFAVATSSMPATGVSLPFISYGGTSMLVLMGSMGIMLNISKYSTNHNDNSTLNQSVGELKRR